MKVQYQSLITSSQNSQLTQEVGAAPLTSRMNGEDPQHDSLVIVTGQQELHQDRTVNLGDKKGADSLIITVSKHGTD